MNCKEIFGRQFLKARTELEMSQQEVADALNLSRGIISSWENGKSSPLLERLDEISTVLRKPITYFFTAVDNDSSFGMDYGHLAELTREAFQESLKLWDNSENLARNIGYLSEALFTLMEVRKAGAGDQYLVPWELKLRDQDQERFERFKRDERATLDAAHAARLSSFIKSVRGEEVEFSPIRREEWTAEDSPTMNSVGLSLAGIDETPVIVAKGTYARTNVEHVGKMGADLARESSTPLPVEILQRFADLSSAADAAESKASLAKGREKAKLVRQAVTARSKAEDAAKELFSAQKAAKARLLEKE
jgi:transcriptional regulator with XRE-family HTH domain